MKESATGIFKLVGVLAVIVLLILFPHIFPKPFPQHIMILLLMYVVLGQAWNVLGGYSGQLSLGNQIFLTLGAYTSTMFLVKLGVSPWLGVLPGIVISCLAALAIGTICFNLKGHYFAIATIGLSEIIFIIFLNWNFVNSSYGFQIRFTGNSLLWMTWSHKLPYYYLILVLALLVVAFVWKMDRSTLGIYLRAIKEDEVRVKSLGIDTRKYKLLAFVISASITTVAGTFYAQYVMYIDPGQSPQSGFRPAYHHPPPDRWDGNRAGSGSGCLSDGAPGGVSAYPFGRGRSGCASDPVRSDHHGNRAVTTPRSDRDHSRASAPRSPPACPGGCRGRVRP